MKSAAVLALAVAAVAAGAAGEEPIAFKLGSFERGGKRFVGVVVKDSMVIDLAAADPRRPW
jgi:hypothetical protein